MMAGHLKTSCEDNGQLTYVGSLDAVVDITAHDMIVRIVPDL